MQLQFAGKNFVVSDRIKEYVEEKVGKLDRYLSNIDHVRVEFAREKTKSSKDRNIVQMTLKADRTILRSEDRSEAVYASIDAVIDKMHRQIARYKGKRLNRWQGQGPYAANIDELVMPELDNDVWEELAAEQKRQVVRVKRFAISPMGTEEAIEQMNLLGHDFFVFFNPDAGQINVLYRRSDDNYGVIDPVVE